jgi:hypothetical protein
MHSQGAASVVQRMRHGEPVSLNEVAALQRLETTIGLQAQAERIRELTTDEGTQADSGGGAAPAGEPIQAPPA